MNLYIVRHADALPVGESVRSDFDRPLSERGRSDAMLMAQTLAQIDLDVTKVLSSPLVRAVETAEIFGRALVREPEASPSLEPGFSVSGLQEEIFAMPKGGSVVLIGHQPDMGMFISYLISPAHAASVAMETGAVACVQLPSNGTALLRWLLTPETVRRMNFAL